MKKQPNDITVCTLECVLMPNGEVISNGKTLGWFDTLGKYLAPKVDVVPMLGILAGVLRDDALPTMVYDGDHGELLEEVEGAITKLSDEE